MKIDSSQISLSTSGQHLETLHARRETQFEFSSLMDGRMQIENSVQEQERNRQYEWSGTQTIDTAQVTAYPEGYSQALFSAYDYHAQTQNRSFYVKEVFDGHMIDLAEHAKAMQQNDMKVKEAPSLLQDIEQMTILIKKIGRALSALSNASSETPDSEKKHGSDFKNVRLDWANINPREQGPNWGGFIYDYEEITSFTRHEKTNINFLANGIVNTEDGQQIDFSLALNFDQEVFESSLFIEKEEGYVFIDPLVINLDGNIPQLSEAKFTFDLDADGETEEIQMLTQGSGFLCLDKNNDGIINDGSELFGPGTGNGFLELLSYDEDQNLWIDENDEVFDELSFWENDGTGNMQLTKIKDAGIGAIYLANSDTPIDITDDENNVQARIKKSGLALNEDGSVASVVEMDWLA